MFRSMVQSDAKPNHRWINSQATWLPSRGESTEFRGGGQLPGAALEFDQSFRAWQRHRIYASISSMISALGICTTLRCVGPLRHRYESGTRAAHFTAAMG